MTMTQTSSIQVRDLHLSYGGVRALRGVSLDLEPGKIVALLGGNGAGKSSLMKCLTGVVQPDEGRILIDGEPVTFHHPNDAMEAGVRVVYQELSLFPTLTITENIIGAKGQGRWVRWHKLHREARKALRVVGADLDVQTQVSHLSVGEQQIVEIVRAVRSGGRLLILDEPTSALGPAQSRKLFEMMHGLAGQGMSIVFVTQDFGRAREHADVVCIMREGMLSQPISATETSAVELIHHAFGADRDVLESTYEAGHITLPPASTNKVLLKVDALQCRPMVSEISVSARQGEVVGIFGSLDSGHIAFAEAVFGNRTRSAGQVELLGRKIASNKPRDSVRAGMGYVSSDRREALAPDHPVADNMTLAHFGRMRRLLLPKATEQRLTNEMIAALRIRSANPAATVSTLSGGNQQKVLFARWMMVDPSVLVLVEPTRGMDIAAKSDVIRIIADLADKGAAVVVVSAEPEIVLSVAHRILVARKGEIIREFVGEDVSVSTLLEAAA